MIYHINVIYNIIWTKLLAKYRLTEVPQTIKYNIQPNLKLCNS